MDIERDAAHEAAQHELAKSIYPKPSLTEQILNWLEDLLYRLIAKTAHVPGGWFTVTVLLLLLVIAIVVAVRIARRAMRSSRGDSQTLFGAAVLSAADHRATAERYAAEGDWAPAIRHRVRAVARGLEENGTLDPVAGRTATELARAAGRAVPRLADELGSAADTFNEVTYGERPGTEYQYLAVAALDDRLGNETGSTVPAGSQSAAAHQPWAEVR